MNTLSTLQLILALVSILVGHSLGETEEEIQLRERLCGLASLEHINPPIPYTSTWVRAHNEPSQRFHNHGKIDSYEKITTVTHKQLFIEVHVHAQKCP